jgi:hypothetical protein
MASVLLRLLCAVLFIWQPMNFAAQAEMTLPSLSFRGPVASLEFAVHAAVAALAAAAGLALWQDRPHGPMLANLALVAMAAVSVQSLYWSSLPSQTSPGTELPLALLAVLHSAAWIAFLNRSERVRRIRSAEGR